MMLTTDDQVPHGEPPHHRAHGDQGGGGGDRRNIGLPDSHGGLAVTLADGLRLDTTGNAGRGGLAVTLAAPLMPPISRCRSAAAGGGARRPAGHGHDVASSRCSRATPCRTQAPTARRANT